MKIKVSFSELQSTLVYLNTVLSDKSLEEKLKNIIFLVTPDTLKVAAYNVFTFTRTELENWSVEEEIKDEGWNFQIKASDLNKIVSSFSSMYKTVVNYLLFEDDGVRIKVTVHEEPLEGEDERLEQDSEFKLESAPILKNIHQEVTKEFPENVDMLMGGDLLLYMDSLFGVMNNDSANSTASKINFAEDYAFVITPYMSAFMKNKLPDAFKGITLTYSSASFLKKLCESEETVGVSKIDKQICVQTGNTEAFMKFQNIKTNYKMYIEKRNKELGIVVDRLYLKDVLKRMGNVSTDGKMLISEGNLEVSNESFHQLIPLKNAKEGTDGIGFSISVPVLEKIIVGRDDVFADDLFLYFVQTPRGYIIYLSDKTGAWFSNTQVTRM